LRKFSVWSRNKRALSPIFATVLLATIIIVFGSVAYYYASNLTTNATNNYSSTISDSQQAIAERIAFENVVYSNNPATLNVYLINCGSANNVQINSVFIYDPDQNIAGVYSNSSSISALMVITSRTPQPTISGNNLNVEREGYFTVTLTGPLKLDTIYTLHLITKSGSAFDYEFST
jgi:hypothetical protein